MLKANKKRAWWYLRSIEDEVAIIRHRLIAVRILITSQLTALLCIGRLPRLLMISTYSLASMFVGNVGACFSINRHSDIF